MASENRTAALCDWPGVEGGLPLSLIPYSTHEHYTDWNSWQDDGVHGKAFTASLVTEGSGGGPRIQYGQYSGGIATATDVALSFATNPYEKGSTSTTYGWTDYPVHDWRQRMLKYTFASHAAAADQPGGANYSPATWQNNPSTGLWYTGLGYSGAGFPGPPAGTNAQLVAVGIYIYVSTDGWYLRCRNDSGVTIFPLLNLTVWEQF